LHTTPTSTITVIFMGVSGSGKTTISRIVAGERGWIFAEGDEFHPPANVAKMRQGIPLNDDDRWPWLRAIADWIGEREAAGEDAVVTCSALRRSYRDLLRQGHPSVWFAHITAEATVLQDRMEHRTDHYMPPSLLPSQLATLEPLHGEPAVEVINQGDPQEVAAAVLARLEEVGALRPISGGGSS